MNRVKRPKLVIAFNTTTQALAFDDVCKLGRLIPLPSEVKAGCGIAYCANLEFENEIDKILTENKIEYFKKQVVELFF
jgi:hypothetical protein